jgi:hypothetical protein
VRERRVRRAACRGYTGLAGGCGVSMGGAFDCFETLVATGMSCRVPCAVDSRQLTTVECRLSCGEVVVKRSEMDGTRESLDRDENRDPIRSDLAMFVFF